MVTMPIVFILAGNDHAELQLNIILITIHNGTP